LYRNGTNLLECLHLALVEQQKVTSELKANNDALARKIGSVIEESSVDRINYLDNSLKATSQCVKSYISSRVKTSAIPNIHSFNLIDEIQKIDPVLWNFIYRLTANEQEEKMLRQSWFKWDTLYIGTDDSNIRLFPRLFIASCIFNAQNSHCVEPLHLLLTDIADKYSGSSTDLISIIARIGAGISKDSLSRFISSKCSDISEQNEVINSSSFAVASFDNLDKNQSYAKVVHGKDRSGFHGTTIQAAFPKPSEKNEPSELIFASYQGWFNVGEKIEYTIGVTNLN
jgi:hypothetical protein